MMLFDLASETEIVLNQLGVAPENYRATNGISVRSPIDGSCLGTVPTTNRMQADIALKRAHEAFSEWKSTPPPVRGELIRLLGEELRSNKDALGRLVSLEAGKVISEGLGEVQEMIDICDFAVGLSRQLHGKTIASERPGHRMMETWHPMGICGVITAFNFPVAVWAWNAALALVCGNPVVWKPSEKTPLTALACAAIFDKALQRHGEAPDHLLSLLIGGQELGMLLSNSKEVPIISATGSTRMGAEVAPVVAGRFGRLILELGGNNAMIVAPSADLDLAVRAIAFSAVGTAGQRCTSLRRVIAHDSIAQELTERLKKAYATLPIGNPLEESTLVGPLIDEGSYTAMQRALDTARSEGGRVTGGERVMNPEFPEAYYVQPAIVEMDQQCAIVQQETFAPIVYMMTYENMADAITMHNDVPQGLSSCIFTTDLREAEHFMSAAGSDCGIVNVNIGPSGAEIGGAFGGEKETGGGRESGSDAWKGYMRRATNTVNYSTDLPLAQGVRFDID